MPQPAKPSRRFSFFGLGSASPSTVSGGANLDPPHLKLETDREVYRPGDLITITIEIKNPTNLFPLLIEKLSFECKGIEKLDSQWFTTPKPTSDSKLRRGEYVFMDCTTPSIVSNQILSTRASKTYSSPAVLSPSQPPKHMKALSAEDDSRLPSASGSVETGASEGVVRGRSYNIRLDDQVLLRFSPKNSDSTYYFSDMIGGTLTFFHEEGARRCLELSITLEAKESVNRRYVHPSRRHSPTITKIHSDHHEVVADLVQTSFLFSIPMDGPMTFSTRYVSVQWALRFEFLTTPKNVDWTRFEHPLLVEGKDKCEWVLPITIHAPPLGAAAAQTRNEKLFSLEPLWRTIPIHFGFLFLRIRGPMQCGKSEYARGFVFGIVAAAILFVCSKKSSEKHSPKRKDKKRLETLEGSTRLVAVANGTDPFPLFPAHKQAMPKAIVSVYPCDVTLSKLQSSSFQSPLP
ncbi:UNVERIFIED_CONTAM: hypothetical protein Sradi_2390000 [Sesamum radiatum]|uniref:RAB6A-GEF complex partner protein 2 n=1 Tax=Sesamum radiatum TaxID=300843 RepID=A0AAW2SHV9_SESRA